LSVAYDATIKRFRTWYDQAPLRFVGWTTKYRYGWVLLLLIASGAAFLLVLGALAAGRPLSRKTARRPALVGQFEEAGYDAKGLWWGVALIVAAVLFTAWAIWTGPTLNRRIPKETEPPRKPWDPPPDRENEDPADGVRLAIFGFSGMPDLGSLSDAQLKRWEAEFLKLPKDLPDHWRVEGYIDIIRAEVVARQKRA
jgi:hypothetical protein